MSTPEWEAAVCSFGASITKTCLPDISIMATR
jgi:hypothetical protein